MDLVDAPPAVPGRGVLDGREEVETVVALVAATDAFAATSIARPITPNAAKLSTVAAMRARAAACGRRRAIGQPPRGPVCGGVTPTLVPVLVPTLVPGTAGATPLPAVPVCGGVAPMPPHCPEIGFVGVALGNGADW
jgi:hypothetical protein